MLNYSLLFLIVGVIAGILGFGFNSGTTASFVKLVAVVCLVLFIASFFRQRN